MNLLKKISTIVLISAVSIQISACGNIYDKEYVYISDYVPAQAGTVSDESTVSLHNFSSLKREIRNLVASGDAEGTVIFADDYDGVPSDDLSQACWEVRTQDALCAYCVENISYELSHIISYDEAKLNITYSDIGIDISDIISIPYTLGLEDHALEAISSGSNKVSLLVNYASYDAKTVESIVTKAYRSNPIVSPRQPGVNVNVFSGANSQRLYEISFSYDVSASELESERLSLSQVELPIYSDEPVEDTAAKTETDESDDAEETADSDSSYNKCLIAYTYLADMCSYSADAGSSIYDALVLKEADSEGLALAFNAVCNSLGLESEIVEGQRGSEEHFWNMVRVEGDYYHLDISAFLNNKNEVPTLHSDNFMWGTYKWDVESYPSCSKNMPLIDVD